MPRSANRRRPRRISRQPSRRPRTNGKCGPLAGVFAQLGQRDRAETDWQKAVELAGKDPMPWILRGRYYAERNEPQKADSDFAQAASLTPNELNKFLEAGWWVAGPCPKEEDDSPPSLDPSRPPPITPLETGRPQASAKWRQIETGDLGIVDLAPVFHADGPGLAYALAYVYSPVERSATLRVGADELVRVWVNGRFESEAGPPADGPYVRWVPIALQAGRNTILVRFTRSNAASHFTVRLADGPFDRATRPFSCGGGAKRGAILRRASRNTGSATWSIPAPLRSCSPTCAIRKRTGSSAGNSGTRTIISSGSMGSYAWLKSAAGYRIRVPIPAKWSTGRFAQAPGEEARKFVLGLAYYRNGQFREAKESIEQNVKATGMGGKCVLALAHFRLGNVAAAKSCLLECDRILRQKVEQLQRDREVGTPDADYGSWLKFLTLLREAREVIEGEPLADDPFYHALLQQAARPVRAGDPLVEDYDQLVAISPNEAVYRIARGRRLAELKRYDEAEADFNKAVALKPSDPQVLAARAAFDAEKAGSTPPTNPKPEANPTSQPEAKRPDKQLPAKEKPQPQ